MAQRVPTIAGSLARPLRRAGACASVAATLIAGTAHAATDAGTAIPNTARLAFNINGDPAQVPSNTVVLKVDEVLDVAVAAAVPTLDIAAGDAAVPVAFVVRNEGNSDETFALAARVDRSGASIAGIAADDDGNGAYDPAVDHRLDPAQVALKAGARQRVFVLVEGVTGGSAIVTAVATAETGHGEPGKTFPGLGTGGVDAIVGQTGARASARTTLTPGARAPRLLKSQTVVDPAGGARAMPGAIITYTLEARFPGAARAVEIDDPIPAGTQYVPGTLTLDGQPLTDTADGDAARFDAGSIRVSLGDIAAASARTITFKTKIQ